MQMSNTTSKERTFTESRAAKSQIEDRKDRDKGKHTEQNVKFSKWRRKELSLTIHIFKENGNLWSEVMKTSTRPDDWFSEWNSETSAEIRRVFRELGTFVHDQDTNNKNEKVVHWRSVDRSTTWEMQTHYLRKMTRSYAAVLIWVIQPCRNESREGFYANTGSVLQRSVENSYGAVPREEENDFLRRFHRDGGRWGNEKKNERLF